jgi:SAM-dependent methyltransferase
MPTDRSHLRTTFDEVALLYDRARPSYPPELFDDVVALSGIPDGGRILEVGCGTGIATEPFARRGYRIDAVELGANLAAVAEEKFAAYPGVSINVGDFEQMPISDSSYDLAISAQAFHWIDPEVGYPKLARALVQGGSIALWWHVDVRTTDEGFLTAVQPIYDREMHGGEHRPFVLPRPEEAPVRYKDQIDRTGLFGEVTIRTYQWDGDYTAVEYIDLLRTFSDHIAMEPAARDRFFQGIADLIDGDYGGRITKERLTVLCLARRGD